MTSFGSKDNQLHVANHTSENFYVLVSPNAEWDIWDNLAQTVKEGAEAAKGARGKVSSISKAIKNINNARNTALKAASTVQAGISKAADGVNLEGDISADDAREALGAIETGAFLIRPGEVLRVAQVALDKPNRYFTVSGWASISGADDVTLTIWSAARARTVTFDTNSDHSWIIQEKDVVRAVYGKLHVVDEKGKRHRFDEGRVVLHASTNYQPRLEEVAVRTDYTTETRGVKPAALKSGWYYQGRPEQVLKPAGRYDDTKVIAAKDDTLLVSKWGKVGPNTPDVRRVEPFMLGYESGVKSMRVEPGCRVFIFENAQFAGKYRVVTQDEPALEYLGENKNIPLRYFIIDEVEQVFTPDKPLLTAGLYGIYQLQFQEDGNLVLTLIIPNRGSAVLWATETRCSGGRCVRQTDGNLVIYNAQGQPIWQSGILNPPLEHTSLWLEPDGNLVIRGPGVNGLTIWESRTPKVDQNFINHFLDPERIRARVKEEADRRARPESKPLIPPTPRQPPGVVQLYVPARDAKNVSTSPIFSWIPYPNATTYTVEVRRFEQHHEYHRAEKLTQNAYALPQNLISWGADFYWWVRAFDQSGNLIGGSEYQLFSTLAAPPLTEEARSYTPSLASPADKSVGLALTPNLGWTAKSGAWATAYQVQISLTLDFSNLWWDIRVPVGETSFKPGLEAGKTCYWRVRTIGSNGVSEWSQPFTFATAPHVPPATPVVPAVISPVGGEIVQMPPTLRWSAASDAKDYGLVISLSDDFSSSVFDRTVGNFTDKTLSGLAGNTRYYWKVVAINGTMASAFSNVGSFQTGSKPPQPNLNMWGNNTYSQLTMPEDLGLVKKVVAGREFTIALRANNTIQQWGNVLIPIPPGTAHVFDFAAGEKHIVVLKNDGLVEAWGDNTCGQLNLPAGLTGVKDIAAGHYHTLALLWDGTIKTWGGVFNGVDQYALSTMPASLDGNRVKAVAAGGRHSVVLLENGTVVAWGGRKPWEIQAPANASGVKAIAAGNDHVVALKEDGTVLQWGDSEAGEVPAGLKDVVAIAAAVNHSLALKKDGTVIGWGQDLGGEIAQAPQQPATLNAIDIAIGSKHAMLRIELAEEKAERLVREAEVARKTAETAQVAEQQRLWEEEQRRVAEDVISTMVASPVPQPPVSSQLAHWKFNGNGNDASSQGHTAQPQGGVAFSANFFQGTSGATFDGATAYMLSDAVDVGKAFTLSAWVFLPAPVTRGYQSFSTIMASSPISGRPNGFKFFVDNQSRSLVFESGNMMTLTEFRTETAGSPIPEGKWVFVAVVVKPPVAAELPFGYATLYINDMQAGSGNAQANIPTNRTIYFGGYGTLEWALKGTIADVRIYNTALTPDEVKAVYLRAESEALAVAAAPVLDANALAAQAALIAQATVAAAEEARMAAEAQAKADAEAKAAADALAATVAQAAANTQDLGLNKPATASSTYSNYVAGNAMDGNSGTHWWSNGAPPQAISVDLGSIYSISSIKLLWGTGDYPTTYQIQTRLNSSDAWVTQLSVTGATGGQDDRSFPTVNARYVQLNLTASPGTNWIQLVHFGVYGTAIESNLALNKAVTASSEYNTTWKAANVVDGNATTRWDSLEGNGVDPQWICVDLGATYHITRVKLNWEAAYATAYQVQVSNDTIHWTTLYATMTGAGGIADLAGLSGSGRYVRMYGTARSTNYGYSLWEFEVYGN